MGYCCSVQVNEYKHSNGIRKSFPQMSGLKQPPRDLRQQCMSALKQNEVLSQSRGNSSSNLRPSCQSHPDGSHWTKSQLDLDAESGRYGVVHRIRFCRGVQQ